jgi:peptide subunit release factor 1 (eRF1)
MGFYPVKRVRHRVYPTQMQAELAERLRVLADLPPATDVPYLTVSLDWRPEGSDPEYRGGLQRFEHEAHTLHQEHWPRGPVYDSLGRDIERIKTYLNEELDPSAQGVFIVANSSKGVFEAMPLGMPLETRISAGPVPALLSLARLDEDYPTYAVLVADQKKSSVSLITQAHRVDELSLKSSDYPRKQHAGGWSQRRFQQRADERLMALGRDIVEETHRYLRDHGIDALIIAGDDVMLGTLDRVMPNEMREWLVETIRLDIDASEREIQDATMPIAERAEQERELAAVMAAKDRRGSQDGAALGSAEVLKALVRGQADMLIMTEDFHEDGWADFTNQRYGAGDEADLFVSGGTEFDAAPIDVEQEMVRLAIKTDAEIDVIHAAVPVDQSADAPIGHEGEVPRSPAAVELDKLGGVAAILRY